MEHQYSFAHVAFRDLDSAVDFSFIQPLAQIAERVAAKSADSMFDAKNYRDATTIGRNVAIEVLEFFDKQKFCKRVGDKRAIERSAREAFNP